MTTLLKYLRGSDFTERHWREIFGLLDMEYKKPDTIQVKDFLNVALHIKKQMKALQVRTHSLPRNIPPGHIIRATLHFYFYRECIDFVPVLKQSFFVGHSVYKLQNCISSF